MRPTATILAGPNGAGKSTLASVEFAREIESGCFLFANDADEGSSVYGERLAPEELTGRLNQAAGLVRRQTSFVLETSLSSTALLDFLPGLRQQGYDIFLLFLFISDPDLSIFRVAQRAQLGGAYVSADLVLRRYQAGIRHLPAYIDAVTYAKIFLSDGEPREILTKSIDGFRAHDPDVWRAIEERLG